MINDFKKSLEDLLAKLKTEAAGIRTSRANTALVENIHIEAYGNRMPLKSVGNINIQPPNIIVIEPWDASLLGAIEKAIQTESELGLMPVRETKFIRVTIPPLTEERRKQLVKLLGTRKEEVRVAARRERDEFLKTNKIDFNDKKISEDDYLRAKSEADKEIKKFEEEVDKIYAAKEKEILL